jgi:thiosulfate reductase cytochrome b subunit
MRLYILTFFLFTASLIFAQNMHPAFPLLDAQGENVLKTAAPVSTLHTCGGCHDTQYIAAHSFHSDAGFSKMTAPGTTASGRPWDVTAGMYGRWNPMIYRYLSPAGDDVVDMNTDEWIRVFGARHVGGGPAAENRGHEAVEMNCFLCHISKPNNAARIEALKTSQFAWANTATLEGTGIVDKVNDSWRYITAAFTSNGNIKSEFLTPQDPTNDHCGQCHGLVSAERKTPLITPTCSPQYWMTETTGQIISPQRLVESGLNLAEKSQLSRPWDIHAERVVNCADCHYSINNPMYFEESKNTRPAHLKYSPRRQTINDYLYQPSHEFARGASTYSSLSPELLGTMRRCESCHDYKAVHQWLPYRERHMQAVTCESCHIPKMYAPARRVLDWTMITPEGEPRMECRGFNGEPRDITTLISGFQPVLLPRLENDGRTRLAPYNMITFWYWSYGDPERPVRLQDLEAAITPGGTYHADILKALDQDHDGKLSKEELALDSEKKVQAVKERLEEIGLSNLQIRGEIQPYAIHHTVAEGEWVIRDCESCHNRNSRLAQPFLLAENPPAAALPLVVGDANIARSGQVVAEDGKLFYQENVRSDGFFILGHDRVTAVQVIGAASVLLMILGIGIHGFLRVLAYKKRGFQLGPKKTVYMYPLYERFWHWLQALTIIGLIFTGLVIHAPSIFGLIAFESAVYVHNVLAFILLVNAFLAVFYHFASGAIRRFLPEPKGFFSQAVEQAMYYLSGIFKGEKHPFEKNPEVRLNPLQKITYLIILNILLPLQVITGILIWGAQHFPAFLKEIGGLGTLVPFHSLIAWFFAAFLIMHIYLTTTGYSPMASIKAMIVGWEDIEAHEEK